MKIDITEVHSILKKNQVDTATAQAVVKELEKIAQEERDSKVPTKKTKNEFVVIISDPQGELAGKELTGWVTQIKADDDAGTILDRIKEGAREFNNTTKKGKKHPVRTIGEAILYVTRKFFKARNVQVKTKEPVRVLITNNVL